jgi:hypothetical protein
MKPNAVAENTVGNTSTVETYKSTKDPATPNLQIATKRGIKCRFACPRHITRKPPTSEVNSKNENDILRPTFLYINPAIQIAMSWAHSSAI